MEKSALLIGIGILIAGGLVALAILRQRPQALPQPQSFMNEETWEWVDYKGRERKITVHRVIRPIWQ